MLRPADPIQTRRLLLRPFASEDLDALHAIQSQPGVVRYLYWGPRSRAEVRATPAQRLTQDSLRAEGDKMLLAMLLRDGGMLIGDGNLHWLSWEHGSGEFEFVLHPDHQGRGLAAEAATVVLKMGFEDLGLYRMIGRYDPRKLASGRLMERLGMRREAHFRENEIVKGERTDEFVYAMLAPEWAAMCMLPEAAAGRFQLFANSGA